MICVMIMDSAVSRYNFFWGRYFWLLCKNRRSFEIIVSRFRCLIYTLRYYTKMLCLQLSFIIP